MWKCNLRYWYSENLILNRAILDISIVLKEITIWDSIEESSPVESEIVRVVSLWTTESADRQARNTLIHTLFIFGSYW